MSHVSPSGPRRRGAAARAPALALAVLAAVAAGGAGSAPAAAADHAVVVMYHRFGDGRHPSTNVTLEQFEAHLAELRDGKYRVLPLPEIVTALKNGAPLPDRAVGLSIDDAFLSVYREAWPRLKAEGLPFTLFVATDPLDRGSSDYMNWDQVRELRDGGVTIGSQTGRHPHMPDLDPAALAAELARSNARFVDELGTAPKLFAYPYGEFDLDARKSVADAGFAAAFGQHSGVIFRGMDMTALPRFAFNESYGDIDRFRLSVNALPLVVSDVTPLETALTGDMNPPAFGFTVAETMGRLDQVSCYGSGYGKAAVHVVGGRRLEVRVPNRFPPGRARINCTMPGPDGRWRWFGMQFYVPGPKGRAVPE